MILNLKGCEYYFIDFNLHDNEAAKVNLVFDEYAKLAGITSSVKDILDNIISHDAIVRDKIKAFGKAIKA
jgi:Mg2+/Co2+ transporter CorB